jgi:hypothetical protein
MSVDSMPVHRFEAAGLGKAPFTLLEMQRIVFQACPGAPIQAGGSCDYCGTAICYAFRIQSADGRSFKVGSDCVEKVGDAGLAQKIKRVRAAYDRELRMARRERARSAAAATREEAAKARRKAARAAAADFAAAHGLVACFRVALKGPKRGVAIEFLGKLRDYGSLTPAQTAFLKSIGTRSAPAPTGRVTFTATIESVKSREGYRGSIEYKMTVRADAGFRAWMTAPVSLLDVPGIGLDRFKGQRVEVTATLEPSREDAGFAFGKRPKVAVLEAAAA